MTQTESISIKIGNQEVTFETGKIARLANGSTVVRCGDTIVFASACCSKEPLEGIDFLPLRADYQEKFSSTGKTLGGFIKREGKPSEKEILVSRLIDRPLRPFFENGWFHDTQVLSYVWSYDGIISPEPLAICAVSAALAISNIPLIKPIGAVRVGLIDEKFIINPTVQEQETSKLDLMLAGTEDAVLMIEGSCDFLTEEQVLEAIEKGHDAIKQICQALTEWQARIGKPKLLSTLRKLPNEVLEDVKEIAEPLLEKALRIASKNEREEQQSQIFTIVLDKLCQEENPKHTKSDVQNALKKISSNMMREMILSENIRSDGRKNDEIRPISVEIDLFPRTHGSALFTRGETQSVSVCTLGGTSMAQRYEDLDTDGSRKFYLQYFFPPFSVGEVGRMGPPGRREIGHGKLAERALSAILPDKEQFPYTIRLESNITESNGSSSMASVCGGCIAMMAAGVPIERPIAGIAMGLILEKDRHIILSDILGIEDSLGDMDFKVAGNHEGITSFQMDIKVEGITTEIMKSALAQAKEGRVHILNKMIEACPNSKEMSIYAPRIEILTVNPSKIGALIGPGGKQIRAIIEETNVQIDINDEGKVSIVSSNLEGIEKAKQIIAGLIAEAEIGKTYDGKVTKIMQFGAFVEILPGKEGLCHISEYDAFHIKDLKDHIKEGDPITVKVIDINDRGQIKLSRKATLLKQNR